MLVLQADPRDVADIFRLHLPQIIELARAGSLPARVALVEIEAGRASFTDEAREVARVALAELPGLPTVAGVAS